MNMDVWLAMLSFLLQLDIQNNWDVYGTLGTLWDVQLSLHNMYKVYCLLVLDAVIYYY